MAKNSLKMGALLIVLACPIESNAAIGDFTGTSSPTVITPQTTEAPQTPPYPTQPFGTEIPVAPRGFSHHMNAPHTAPRVVTPPAPGVNR